MTARSTWPQPLDSFEDDGLDPAPLRELWRSAVAEANRSARSRGAAAASAVAFRGDPPPDESIVTRRASVAVMPFASQSPETDFPGGISDGLAHDVITRLAKLRHLFVIAQGTVFALSERSIDPQEAARMLNVDYVVKGTSQRQGNRLTVTVELTETRTARVVWAEVYSQACKNTFAVLDEIGDRIVASIASEIEAVERNRAVLKPPSSLDAWEAHHRGLWHMYRFNRADNVTGPAFLPDGHRIGPHFCTRLCRTIVHAFPKCFSGLERASA